MQYMSFKELSPELRDNAWRLVEESFPLAERRSLQRHCQAMDDPEFFAEVVMDQNALIAIVFYWIYDEKYCFVEHLASVAHVRGKGYGAQIMEHIKTKAEIVLLEIEPPVDEITVRRKGFYQRAGFVLNDNYLHIHPTYSPLTKPIELKVMSYPRALDQQEFLRFRDYSLNHILKYVDQ